VLTIVFGPIGLLGYLAVRGRRPVAPAADPVAAAHRLG
jgi:hypothetical protein